jgi:site-specific recombinase XerD
VKILFFTRGRARVSPSNARHTSGSSRAVVGAGQKVIATLLGHADTHATARYTDVQVDATRALVGAQWERLGQKRS